MKPYYARNGVEIYQGDGRDVIADLPDASLDLLLTDPPYGMAYVPRSDAGAAGQNVKADGARQGVRIVRGVLREISHKLKPDAHAYCFCHWESWPDFYDALSGYMPIRNALIWHKAKGSMGNFRLEFAKDYEVILYAARGGQLHGARDGAVLRGFKPVHPSKRIHITEKPVALLAYLLQKSTRPGETVIDPFMGSGSTLEAAARSGRRALGVDLDEGHCERAAKRLDALFSQAVIDPVTIPSQRDPLAVFHLTDEGGNGGDTSANPGENC